MTNPATSPIDRLLDDNHSRLVAVFDTCPEQAILDELTDAGFEKSFDVHCGGDGARLIDFSGTEYGLLARISHALRHLTDEGEIMHHYESALAVGHCGVMVLTPGPDHRQLEAASCAGRVSPYTHRRGSHSASTFAGLRHRRARVLRTGRRRTALLRRGAVSTFDGGAGPSRGSWGRLFGRTALGVRLRDRQEARRGCCTAGATASAASAVAQTRLRTVAGSRAQYSLLDVRDNSNVVDWFPGDHPTPMPEIITHGPAALGDRKWGCGSCHLPNGMGRPENAPAGGLPAGYILRQLQDFRSGRRRTADPRKPNTNTLIALAMGMTEQEMREAADYFSAVPYVGRIRVVESDLVPPTRIVNNLFLPTSAERTEPIAGRIIEVPEDESQTELLRNPHIGFVAYVPPGSLEKGKDLVTTGGMTVVGNTIVQGRTTACLTCHGLDLMGVAEVPPIAGRSASYIARQMWDIQQGTRNGEAAQLMKMAIARLTADDITAVAAYVASRPTIRTEPVANVDAR